MSDRAYELNLARKCRPRHFNDVVGQDLSVRILQNGLYLKKMFPLYIFSGQRGCGKTTTARIFAAAVNCEKLIKFQMDPKINSVPCLKCSSCKTFQAAHHPDFIEMDAASHTGVDNIRQLLDSALHMPISGAKKIYLIDEAHMLSRAAFNAFLKMLEEPPSSVLFILATTELHKIPDTVRSRAFHVLFGAVQPSVLTSHLQRLSEQESITIDDKALALIASESEGSVRDAVNLLDQARLTGASVSYDDVLKLLGKMREQSFFNIFALMCDGNTTRLLQFLQEISFEHLVPRMVWDMLVHLCRALLWIHHGIDDVSGPFQPYKKELGVLSKKCSSGHVQTVLNMLWLHEEHFLRTGQKHLFLETLLIKICTIPRETMANPEPEQSKTLEHKPHAPQHPKEWMRFLDAVETVRDQLLSSICKKAVFQGVDAEKKAIRIGLASYNVFFQDKLTSRQQELQKIISDIFPGCEGLSVEEIEEKKSEKPSEPISSKPLAPPAPQLRQAVSQPAPRDFKRTFSSKKGSIARGKPAFDVSNTARWPKAALLRSYFPGKIEKVEK